MRRFSLSSLSACLLLPTLSFGAIHTAPIVLPDLPGYPPIAQHTIGNFTVDGFAGGAYNHLSQSAFFTSGQPDRFNDIEQNGFILNQIGLAIAKQPEQGLGGLLSVMLGRDTYSIAPYGMQPWIDSQNAGFLITQAYLQYAIPSLKITVGQFFDLAGFESIVLTQIPNYSGSLLSGNLQPTTNTGIRATYAVNNKLNLIIGINNGPDNIRDWSRRKTLELGVNYIDPKYTLSAAWYNGQERVKELTSTGPLGIRNFIDLVASVNVTDKLTLALNYDYVTQNRATLPSDDANILGSAKAQGIAGYVLYQFNPKWRAALRMEYFDDGDGFATDMRQNIKEATITLGYMVCKNFEMRAETRRDVASTDSFLGTNGVSTSNNLQSYAVAAVITF